jgi:hypothetical protein
LKRRRRIPDPAAMAAPAVHHAVRALLLAAAFVAAPAAAQDPPPAPAPDTLAAPAPDAAPALPAAAAPTPAPAPVRPAPAEPEGGISPRGAFLRSLVLPGWGQSELGAPVRGGVFFAMEAGSLWMLYKSDRRLREALRQQRIARETGALDPGRRLPLVRDRQNQREDWLTLSIFFLFFSGADAFVAAHLQDFDVRVGATPGPGGTLELRAAVPLRP